MSHFAVLVLVDHPITRAEAEDAVTPLLAAYDENATGEETAAPDSEPSWFREGSRWDWWQIGGRWTGSISPDPYDPEEDPENFKTCFLCGGTGRRPDAARFEEEHPGWRERMKGCNGCLGKGWEVAWPTDWRDFDGDVQPVRSMQFKTYRWDQNGEEREAAFVPTAIVTPDGKWTERTRMGWFGVEIPDEDGNEPKDEETWASVVGALLDQYPEATAVVVDCHV